MTIWDQLERDGGVAVFLTATGNRTVTLAPGALGRGHRRARLDEAPIAAHWLALFARDTTVDASELRIVEGVLWRGAGPVEDLEFELLEFRRMVRSVKPETRLDPQPSVGLLEWIERWNKGLGDLDVVRFTAPGHDEATAATNAPPVATNAPPVEVKPVYWNTRVLDGEVAQGAFITVGRAYTLTTGIDPVALAGAAVSALLAAGGLPDATKITFQVSCPQSILRDHDDGAGPSRDRVSFTSAYDAATGTCGPARFGLVATAPGRITLALNLLVDNAVRASTLVPLLADLADAAAPPEPMPAPVALGPAALTSPGAQLRLELTSADQLVVSSDVRTDKPRAPSSSWSAVVSEALRARQELVASSRSYRVDPARPDAPFAILDGPATMLRMAKAGAALHERFFGWPGDGSTDLDTQALAEAIAGTADGARLQVVAGFQPFPWAVFYDGAYREKPLTDDPASVDPSCFWGHRFRIDRVITGRVGAALAPTIAAPARVQACLNAHLDEEQGTAVLTGQRAMFDGIAGVLALTRIESTAAFVAYLRSDVACDLLYVFCHATAAVTLDALFTYAVKAPETQAKLIFESGKPLDVAAMRGHRRDKALVGHPLVFLNACASAAGDQAFQSPMLEQFLGAWGAAGVLGTDWEVPTVFADRFARRVLMHFLRDRVSIGEAFRRATHAAFAEGNPFPLVYALYARPELTITTTPSAGGVEP